MTLTPVFAADAPVAPTASPPPDALIEIALGDATVRVRGAVDAQQLRTVIDCLARRA